MMMRMMIISEDSKVKSINSRIETEILRKISEESQIDLWLIKEESKLLPMEDPKAIVR